NQSLLFFEYLRRKYMDRKIDVVVAAGFSPLEFLLKHRSELFSDSPIVFSNLYRPTLSEQMAGPGMTGVTVASTYRETLELAIKLHPGTEQIFIISGGTPENDKKFERVAREELKGFES